MSHPDGDDPPDKDDRFDGDDRLDASPRPEGDGGPHHVRRELAELLEDAVAAEIETGEREASVSAAERNLVLRALRVVSGVVVVCIGLTLVVLPGPGLLVIAGGLALMAQDVPFARRWLRKVRARLPADDDGGVAGWVIAVSGGACALSIGVSAWWTFLR